MNLTEYLKSTDEYDRAYKFAQRAGLSVTVIYGVLRMERGQGKPYRVLLDTALKIRAASSGAVSLERLGQGCPSFTS